MPTQMGDDTKIEQASQDGALKPIADNPRLPSMPVDPAGEAPRGTTGATMMPKIKEAVNMGAKSGKRTMEPFTPGGANSAAPNAKPATEMKPRPLAAVADVKQGYLLLRARAINDKIQIISAKAVEGPLAQPTSLVGQHTYEIVLDAQRLQAEGIPDLSVSRSYPRPGQHEHHITERKVFEFNIRIPLSVVPSNALDRIKINLYRFSDALPKAIPGTALLSAQYGKQAQIVATLDGIRAERIEPSALDQLKVIFPSAFGR
jgi:hypothetical protein